MHVIDKAAYEGDIVSRLRNWRGLHLAHSGELFEEAADEIEKIRAYRDEAEDAASIANLAALSLRLTDDEWGAIAYYVGTGGPRGVDATLRSLLERTK
jgi:hypothetical protein